VSFIVRIKSLSSASLAKVFGIMYLIFGIILSPFLILMASAESGTVGIAESVFFIVFTIIFYGIFGLIGGFILGIVNNFIAKQFGGIEVEVEAA